jgi:hypothetical protein
MENNQITVTDLRLVREILNVASTRGTFKAEELKTVGELYERLNNFLVAFEAAQEQANGDSDAGESTDEETQTGE